MKKKDQIPAKTAQTIAQILVNVLLRRFNAENPATRAEKT